RRRHTRFDCDWSSDVCSSDLADGLLPIGRETVAAARDCVDGILDEVAARYRERLCPAIPRVWEDGINGIRADLREWLRRAVDDRSEERRVGKECRSRGWA